MKLAQQQGKNVSIHLFGQEVNPETYAICKADMLLKGDGDQAEHISYGSTLSMDGNASRQFVQPKGRTPQRKEEIVSIFIEMEQSEAGMIFDNEGFGCWSVTASVLKKIRPFITEKDPTAQPIDGEPDASMSMLTEASKRSETLCRFRHVSLINSSDKLESRPITI